MRLHRSILLAASAALPLASAAAQAPFEGVVNMRMTSENATTEGTVFVKGTRSRMEFSTGGQQMYMVMDAEKATTMMVMPAQRMYMVLDVKAAMEQMGPAAQGRAIPDVKVEATGRKETIAGYECEHITITSTDGVTDACVARGMGSFMGVAGPPARGRGPDIPPELRELANRYKDAFLLKAETVAKGGQVRMALVVTKIEKKSVDGAMFEAPAGFQDMSGMMPGRRPPGGR